MFGVHRLGIKHGDGKDASRKSVASEDLRKVVVHHLEGGHNILSFVESRGVEALSRPITTLFHWGLEGGHPNINFIHMFIYVQFFLLAEIYSQ